jgi:hypothetical protein
MVIERVVIAKLPGGERGPVLRAQICQYAVHVCFAGIRQ